MRRALVGVLCLLLAPIATAAIAPPPLAAQQPDSTRQDTTKAHKLAPIEVVGSIQPSAGPSITSTVPARVTILTGVQVDTYEPRILSDVLAQQTGFSLYDDLGSSYKLGMSSRGFFASPVIGTPQGLSVFLDGVRQNEPDASEVNFDLLPMQYIGRIELVSGTATVAGRNSLGGAINLITLRGEGPPSGELELQGGTYGTFNGNGSVSGSTRGGLSYFVGGGYNREDGWRQATGAHQYNGFFNLGKFTDTWGLNLQGFGANSRAETAGSLPTRLFDTRPDSNFTAGDFEDLDLLQGALSGYKQAGNGRLSFRTYYRHSTGDRFNVNQPDDPDARNRSHNNTLGWGADYRWGHTIGAAVLGVRIGTDGTVNRSQIQLFADSTKFGGGLNQATFVKSPLWDVSGFASADLTLGRVTFSLGGRYDYVRIPFEDQLDPANDTTNSYSRFDPKGGISAELGGGLSIYGSVGRNFRAPALIEVACADPTRPCVLPFSLSADPPIAPVTATTYETGATWARGPVLATASAYWSEVRNDIFLFGTENPVTGSTINGFFANIPKTRRQGVEVGVQTAFGRGHSAYLNYAFTRATFQSTAVLSTPIDEAGEETVVPGDEVPLVPKHVVQFGADFHLPAGVELRGDGRYIGEQWLRGDEANVDAPLPGYFVADAKVSWEVGPWTIAGLVTNVFDKHYAVFGTFNVDESQPGSPIDRFLTPGSVRTVRLVLRREFGGGGPASVDRD